MKTINGADIKTFLSDAQGNAHNLTEYRKIFFNHFRLSDNVPEKFVPAFIRLAKNFYDSSSLGYNGIISEISERVELLSMIDGSVPVREFFVHKAGKTDIWDKENHIGYEKKTGCGDWLCSEKSVTFAEVIEEYKRKRTRILWDYDFIPVSSEMNGKKSVNKNMTEEEQKKAQEKVNPKKTGKQYEIHIHIDATFRRLFEYLETYDKGIGSFFKESSRSGVAGFYRWEMQTLKNSNKKIKFLEHFNVWNETGLSLDEYRKQNEENEEE